MPDVTPRDHARGVELLGGLYGDGYREVRDKLHRIQSLYGSSSKRSRSRAPVGGQPTRAAGSEHPGIRGRAGRDT